MVDHAIDTANKWQIIPFFSTGQNKTHINGMDTMLGRPP